MGGQNDYDVGVRAMRGFMADFPKEWIRTGGHFKVLAYRSLWLLSGWDLARGAATGAVNALSQMRRAAFARALGSILQFRFAII